MNAIQFPTANRASFQTDWVINYVEVNSQPSHDNDFSWLRITSSEIQIEPAGIALSIQKSIDHGVELRSGADTYFATFIQRGSELVVKLHRCDSTENVVIVAKRSVSEFDPSKSFVRTSYRGMSERVAQSSKNELISFF